MRQIRKLKVCMHTNNANLRAQQYNLKKDQALERNYLMTYQAYLESLLPRKDRFFR